VDETQTLVYAFNRAYIDGLFADLWLLITYSSRV